MQQFSVTGDVHTIRKFLEFKGFFRRFATNFAIMVLPLTNLTKTRTKLVCSEVRQVAFDKLKYCLVIMPVMTMFNQNAFLTEVHTEASLVGIEQCCTAGKG